MSVVSILSYFLEKRNPSQRKRFEISSNYEELGEEICNSGAKEG